MCSSTWVSLSSAYFFLSVHTVNVCWFAAVLSACESENPCSSAFPSLNMLQSFGLLWLVTTVIACHSCCHLFYPQVAHCLISVNALFRHSGPLTLTNLVISVLPRDAPWGMINRSHWKRGFPRFFAVFLMLARWLKTDKHTLLLMEDFFLSGGISVLICCP